MNKARVKCVFERYEEYLPDVVARGLEQEMNGQPPSIKLTHGNVARNHPIRGMYSGDLWHCARHRAENVERFGGLVAADFDTFLLLCAELVRKGELTL